MSSTVIRRLLQADAGTFHEVASAASDRKPWSHRSMDSSMALTILVVLTAMVFIGFFSVYLRRFSTTFNSPPPSSSSSVAVRTPSPEDGLDASVMKSLPLLAYGRAARRPMTDDCPICLSEFQEEEELKLIPYCSHVFHPGCIDAWFESHATCPVCRSAQLLRVEV